MTFRSIVESEEGDGDTGPRDELSASDEVDPPVEDFDRSLREGEVRETADEERGEDTEIWNTLSVETSKDPGSSTLLCQAEHGSTGRKDERVGSRKDGDENDRVDKGRQDWDTQAVHRCY